VVALDSLRSAENVGVIARNCAAFGVDVLVAGEQCCSPYLRRAVRNSMGAVFRLPVVHAACLAGSLRSMRSRFDTRIVISDPHASSTIYSEDLRGSLCLVLGNEDSGVSPEVSALATSRIAVPMLRQTDSLNVACATAVFLFEACRQRRNP
jgi:TrmH family RNA methyltransferase